MKRRTFLRVAGCGLGGALAGRSFAAEAARGFGMESMEAEGSSASAYGSGHFGRWVRDAHELPAYEYTCNQLTDPLAVLPVDKEWRSPTDHMHQLGNDRLVAVASNYGHIQVRQDEGAPKFLNDYNPAEKQYGGGLGFLADDSGFVLSTFYTGKAEKFDRTFGVGYLRKRVAAHGYEVDQVVFAPFGDDPVLVSQVTIANRSTRKAGLRWVEYWGCQNYQFSYRSLMESGVLGGSPQAPDRRRALSERFAHTFEALPNGRGLREQQTFSGRSKEEEQTWERTQQSLREKPTGFFGGPTPPLPAGASMDDLAPPPTFLASLDAPADALFTNAAQFFKSGVEQPSIPPGLESDLSTKGPESAFLIERRMELQPGETRTLYFLYGYVPEGFREEALIEKYATAPASLWSNSCARWKGEGIRFASAEQPWMERESAWSSYYLRSGFSYDHFFGEHIVSQGAGYQYLAGMQCAARDPLQHILPLIFWNPGLVRSVLRYTLKEMQADGSLPYAIVGHGVPAPCVYRPSDLQLWLLWTTSEYVLATRDRQFLEERIPRSPRQDPAPTDPTVLDLLALSFKYATEVVGTGKHGLMRIFNGDWNDSIVYTHLTPEERDDVTTKGESVLNAAMASYVFDYYATLLDLAGRPRPAQAARVAAKRQREAVQTQFTGQWYRRAWLNDELGWVGEKQMWLEPQPWALLGGCVPGEKQRAFTVMLNELARKPSPIGAMLQSQPDPTMKDEPGTGTNGGVFAAINGTLVWALSEVDGAMAWDEWQKNTLARHAEIYPKMWFGIWSGPDAYHSVFAKWPGGTGPDFPVLNIHSHAWPLYSAVKLLGTAFDAHGVRFRPVIPLKEYEFSSPLLGFRKTPEGYSGWYSPSRAGEYSVELQLPKEDAARIEHLTVNGEQRTLRAADGTIRFQAQLKSGDGIRWQLR